MLRSLQCGSVGRRLVAASLAATLAAVVAVGCNGDLVSEPDTVADILLDLPRVVAVGERVQASAQAIGSNGRIIASSRVKVSFSSRNIGVATVDASSGTVTGVSPGRAAIVAEARGTVVMDTVQVVAR
jgi:hypothetical protein